MNSESGFVTEVYHELAGLYDGVMRVPARVDGDAVHGRFNGYGRVPGEGNNVRLSGLVQ